MRHARKSARVPTHARSMSPAHLPHTKSTHDRTNSWGPAQAPKPCPRASRPIPRDPGRKCEPNGDREVKDGKDDREIRAGPCGQRASERAKYSPRSKLRLLRKGRHDEPHGARLILHKKIDLGRVGVVALPAAPTPPSLAAENCGDSCSGRRRSAPLAAAQALFNRRERTTRIGHRKYLFIKRIERGNASWARFNLASKAFQVTKLTKTEPVRL